MKSHSAAQKIFLSLFACLFFLFSDSVSSFGQEDKPGEKVPVLRQAGGAKLRTLGNIAHAIKNARSEEEAISGSLKAAPPEGRAALEGEMAQASQRVTQLESDFVRIATGVNPADLADTMDTVKSYDWKGELQDFLTPLFQELKDATARPRNIAKLRQEMAFYRKRAELLSEAVNNLTTLAEQTADDDLEAFLEKALKDWKIRKETEENRLAYLEHQIEDLEKGRTSFLDSGKAIVKSFFKSRGRNLVLALSAFFLFLALMRLLHRQIYRYSPWHSQAGRSFLVRAGDLAWTALTVIGAIGVLLMVLYVSEDWVLLSLAIIFLLGLVWTAKQGISQFFEQLKLLLNLGAVRENEKVVYNGIPWLVSSINIYSTLSNPALSGAVLRLPLSAMRSLVSRPYGQQEPWFPCNAGEWVILADGVFGRVAEQNPESVVVAPPGGAFKTYPTQSFLGLAPLNLSKGFRLVEVFGVDYRHQEIATRKIPEIMRSNVEKAIIAEGWGNFIVNVSSVFKSAGASSLDFEVICDITGEGAQYYRGFQRVLNTCFIETATKMGWNIPFKTLTLRT